MNFVSVPMGIILYIFFTYSLPDTSELWKIALNESNSLGCRCYFIWWTKGSSFVKYFRNKHNASRVQFTGLHSWNCWWCVCCSWPHSSIWKVYPFLIFHLLLPFNFCSDFIFQLYLYYNFFASALFPFSLLQCSHWLHCYRRSRSCWIFLKSSWQVSMVHAYM